MGPLVPDIISSNLNLIAALLIGGLFGMILEQAGFSSTRKLVGLFYGYDFTVLRVFFTAGVTAMLGVMALEHFGLLDMGLVYINPAFLWSAAAGGLVMGLGFVLGGFCPGTAFCAAAIGKLDAMLFIGGAFLGVFVFAEAYPLLEGLYKAAHLGSPQIFETLGISQGLFAFLLTLCAMGAFWAASIVENKVNGERKPAVRFTPYYAGLAAAGLLLAAAALLLPGRKAALLAEAGRPGALDAFKPDLMSADEFAFRLLDGAEGRMQIVDFRSEAERAKLALPGALAFTADDLFAKLPSKELRQRGRDYVFAAEDEADARRMALVAGRLGFRRVRVLEGGVAGFRETILNFRPSPAASAFEREHAYRFRAQAQKALPALLVKSAPAAGAAPKAKRALGGC